MLRLAIPNEPAWITLAYGVRFRVRPLTSIVMETARQIAAAEVRDLRKAMESVRAAGATVSDASPGFADGSVAGVQAESAIRLAKALARISVVEWDGVVGEDMAPLPLTPDNLARAMDVPGISTEFVEAYTSTLDVLDAEKKG